MKKFIFILVVIVLICFSIVPFLWMTSTSIKNNSETYTNPPQWIPKVITFENYRYITSKGNFPIYFQNSLIVALISTLLSLTLSALAGYSFSRYAFPGSKFLLYSFLLVQMFPSALLIIPLFQIVKFLGLLDTLAALILANITFALPLCVWLMKGFYDQVPKAMDEAALLDGCSRFNVIYRVIMPSVKAGFVATGIFSFISSWDEFLFALTFTSNDAMRTLPIGLQRFVTSYEVYWNNLAAGSVLVTVPVVIMFLLIQKFLAKGAIAGAVKG